MLGYSARQSAALIFGLLATAAASSCGGKQFVASDGAGGASAGFAGFAGRSSSAGAGDAGADSRACADIDCQHSGRCVVEDGVASCQCAPGFEGDACENNTDECAPEPCSNGGRCVDGIAAFQCLCPPGFPGNNFETAG